MSESEPSSFKLILSRNSIRNCTMDCDALGIHYEVTTPTEGMVSTRIATVKRWDAARQESVLVAEWEKNKFKSNRVRIPGILGQDFIPVNEFLKTTGPWWAGDQTFVAGGKAFSWKPRFFSMKLYCDSGSRPVIIFDERNWMIKGTKSKLEVFPEARDVLDTALVAFLITELQRRDEIKRAYAYKGG